MSRAFNRIGDPYWRRAHGYDRMKFTHDFQADLQSILAELDSGRPFAFNRFADGELAILEQRDIPTADGWSSVNVSDRFRERLLAALRYRHPDYYIGIGCPCCSRDEWKRLMALAGREPDDPQVTFSTVFVNGNYNTAIGSLSTVPFKMLINGDNFNQVNVNDDTLKQHAFGFCVALAEANRAKQPACFALGPAGKIFCAEYHQSFRRGLVDVGSLFDLQNRGYASRSYHDPNHPNRKKICQW
jgi:hypothetical protein